MRRLSLFAAAALPVALAVMLNLATGIVPVAGAWRPAVLTVAAALSVAAVAVGMRQRAASRGRAASGTDLDAAATQLALAVRAQWTVVEERRRVRDPVALPVRWHAAAEHLVDHAANVRAAPVGAEASPVAVDGELSRVIDVYRGVPSRRLVILGRPGGGKSVLAVRLVLDLLDDPRPGEPVPVVLNLGSWDPAIPLRDWLAARLTRDYGGLEGPVRPGGPSLAEALVGTGRILPVLDGFDEIAAGLHRRALEELNGVDLPLVLTSRPEQFAAAVKGSKVLTGAAGIELDDLRLSDLAGYLPRTTTRRGGAGGPAGHGVWAPVLARLRDRPHEPASRALRRVLATPLMVHLARTVYSDTPDRDPMELLDTGSFADRAAIERHLVAAFVPAAYRSGAAGRRRWDPVHARRYLGFLARHCAADGAHELAWWRLRDGVDQTVRWYLGALAGAALGALAFALPVQAAAAWLAVFVTALITQIIVGGKPPGPVPARSRLRVRDRLPFALTTFAAGATGGLVAYGVAVRLAGRNLDGAHPRYGFQPWVGFAYAAVCGLFFVLNFVLQSPLDLRTAVGPRRLLAADRRHTLIRATGNAAIAVASIWLIAIDTFGLRGRDALGLIGIILAAWLGQAITSTAWGQWLIVVRVWLPLRGQLPWAVLAFLDDAHDRGVLRQAGAVDQFRHARLREHLAGRA